MAPKAKDPEVETPETDAVETVPAKKGGRHIMIDDPRNQGTEMKRTEFCRREVGEHGRGRGEVAKQLSEIEGRDVKFQIVYAATKDMTVVKAPKAPAEEPAAEEAAS